VNCVLQYLTGKTYPSNIFKIVKGRKKTIFHATTTVCRHECGISAEQERMGGKNGVCSQNKAFTTAFIVLY